MRRKILAIAAALPVLFSAAPAHAAQAAYANPEVEWVHNVKATADSATLFAKYRCWGGDEGTHLWVSLKQGGGISGPADELAAQEGTSGIAASWYDSHPESVVCNGTWQIQEFTAYREMGIPGYHPEAWESLVAGPAFLQFCLFDSTATEDLSRGFGYLYSYVPVKTR